MALIMHAPFRCSYKLEEFANEIHNPFHGMKLSLVKIMSLAFVQALAVSMLVLPVNLSHEHNALPPVQTILDPRNCLTLLVWLSMAAIVILWTLHLRAAASGISSQSQSGRKKQTQTMPNPASLPAVDSATALQSLSDTGAGGMDAHSLTA
jgi:hypothetical protein